LRKATGLAGRKDVISLGTAATAAAMDARRQTYDARYADRRMADWLAGQIAAGADLIAHGSAT